MPSMAPKLENKYVLIYHLALLSPPKVILAEKVHILRSPLHHIQVDIRLKVITLLEKNIVAAAHCVTRWS